MLEAELTQRPDDYRLHSSLGEMYARLGHRDDAIRHGLMGKELMPPEKDFMVSQDRVWSMALIYALVEEPDLAMDELEYLVSIPSEVSVHNIELEPTFDLLRELQRYKEIITKHAIDV